MHKSHFIVRWSFVIVFVVIAFSGCAVWDRLFPKEEKSPEELMSDGVKNFERGRLTDATEAFQKIKDRYPYSKFAIEAELKMADALYKRGLFDEAIDAYDEFERLHPKNASIPYVIYQKCMCYFSQIGTIDRNQSNTLKAKEEFERLVKKFPKTEYANMGRSKIRECYINLAEHELNVGHFYYKKKKYRAAMGRYRYVLENYPDQGQYHVALEYMSKCVEKLPKEEGDQKDSKKSWWYKLTHPFQ
ncbi:MAG: outer membrane protein assembly factor BamD [Deltaproteobacteria bacterium]|nr:outer membrane protein assembly factor BamD [Deltaproteobacteria bacterium]